MIANNRLQKDAGHFVSSTSEPERYVHRERIRECLI